MLLPDWPFVPPEFVDGVPRCSSPLLRAPLPRPRLLFVKRPLPFSVRLLCVLSLLLLPRQLLARPCAVLLPDWPLAPPGFVDGILHRSFRLLRSPLP
jgi:hypothetical protein